MTSLYAFCRIVDDIADGDVVPVAERQRELTRWRENIQKVCSGFDANIPLVKEFTPVIREYKLPFTLMNELIKGMEMDLSKHYYNTWEELDLYCYRAASVVGLMSIRIFGYKNPKTEEYAVALGKALQYTNILRDVKKDLEKDRIYIPSRTYKKYGVTKEDIQNGRYTQEYYKFANHYAKRATKFYQQAASLLSDEDRPNMIAAELMGAVYWQLLLKLRRGKYNVFDRKPIKLTKFEKIFYILKTWAKFKLGSKSSNYGITK